MSVVEMEPTVAKKKSAQPKLKKTWESKPVAVQVRGSVEFKAALEKVAQFDGKSVASFVDQAVRFYARAIGYQEVIPRR